MGVVSPHEPQHDRVSICAEPYIHPLCEDQVGEPVHGSPRSLVLDSTQSNLGFGV